MNSIILKKHLSENIHELVPTQLSVSMTRSKKVTPYFGLLELRREKDMVIEEGEKEYEPCKGFVETFEQFC